MALLADQRGDNEEAAILYTEAVSRRPDWEEAWFRLGYLHLQQGEYEDSVQAFSQCAKRKPGWVDAQLNLALANWWSGERQPARAALERAHSEQPDNADVLRTLTALTIEMNDLNKALEYQDKLNRHGDHTPELSYNLALGLQEQERWEEAAGAYRHAIEANPGFAEAHLNLGHALKALGQDQEAKAEWEKALSSKPDLASNYF
jgi:tetratricopeptide (TPR) repeat protein